MSKIPEGVRRQVTEGTGNQTVIYNELLVALIDTIADQNAILDDTIHHELHEIKQSMGMMALAIQNRPPQ
jgi:Mg2+ and Co2+ transporter CorA